MNLKHEVAAFVIDFGDTRPVVVANFGFIPKHNNTAGSQPEKIFHVVFTNHRVEVYTIHIQPLDLVKEIHFSNSWNLASQPFVQLCDLLF